jgi:hypothetical protein
VPQPDGRATAEVAAELNARAGSRPNGTRRGGRTCPNLGLTTGATAMQGTAEKGSSTSPSVAPSLSDSSLKEVSANSYLNSSPQGPQ